MSNKKLVPGTILTKYPAGYFMYILLDSLETLLVR